MGTYALRLTDHRFEAGARPARPLPPLNRVLYVLDGDIVVTSGGRESRAGADSAWHGSAESTVKAGPKGAAVLHYELLPAVAVPVNPGGGPGVSVTVLLEHPISLDPNEQHLMRADRVDFPPAGVAPLHRHKGGGIRCLIAGALEVKVGDRPGRLMKPGDAWFESGAEPVYAVASGERPTSFIRVSILPRSIKGQSSIMYVDPSDTDRGRPRKYTVYVDEPIEIS